MNLIEEAKNVVQNLDQRMYPSPYDTAWMARVVDPDTNESRWPHLLNWLLENQHEDGSWGAAVPYYHDRILCTLIAIMALHERMPAFDDAEAMQTAIRHGEQYLWNHLHMLVNDPFELVGFELVFPTLLAEAREMGLHVPNHTAGYGEIQSRKLRLIPPDMLYAPNVSTVHSLEFLGQGADKERLAGAITHGSLGNSPSATAYYSRYFPQDDTAVAYLQGVAARQVPYLYPCSIFELTWTLNSLTYTDLPLKPFAPDVLWHCLREELQEDGIGLDKTFGIPDGDITSVTHKLLMMADYELDADILCRFQNRNGLFRTYFFERNPSVGTNLHALEAIKLLPAYPNREQVRLDVITMLLDQRQHNVYWYDKWHISPFYATAHAIPALVAEEMPALTHVCRYTIDWLLHTQWSNGGWGWYDMVTLEETAYALIALLAFHRAQPLDDVTPLRKGARFLREAYFGAGDEVTFPELWIGKCLYTPHDVVKMAILSALIMYEGIMG